MTKPTDGPPLPQVCGHIHEGRGCARVRFSGRDKVETIVVNGDG